MTDKEIIRAKIAGEIEKLQEKLHFTDAESDAARNIVLAIKTLEPILAFIDSLQEEPVAPKVLEDMLNAKTPAESLGISAEEHDRIVDELIYGKEPEMVDIDDLPKEEPVSEDLEKASKEWLTPQLDKSYAVYGEAKMMELTKFDGYAMLDAIEFGAKCGRNQAVAEIQAQSMALAHGCPKESVSEDVVSVAKQYIDSHVFGNEEDKFTRSVLVDMFCSGAKWQFERVNEALLSEVLPCFMHGGEADEVVAKLEEVLNQKK